MVGGGGEGRLQHLILRDSATGEQTTVDADALFVLIGARPHSDWLSAEIARDTHGFLLTGEEIPDSHRWPLERRPLSLETSMPGVLAAGDVRHASVKRVASAVGEGAIAVQLVHNLLTDGPQSLAGAGLSTSFSHPAATGGNDFAVLRLGAVGRRRPDGGADDARQCLLEKPSEPVQVFRRQPAEVELAHCRVVDDLGAS